MHCTSCGSELPDGSAFCNGCGAAVTQAAKVETVTADDGMPKTPTGKVAAGLLLALILVLMWSVVGTRFERQTTAQNREAGEQLIADVEKRARARTMAKLNDPSIAKREAQSRRERERELIERAIKRERELSELEVTAFSWSKSRSYATVEGSVRNISDKTMDRVQAVALMHDAKGDFVSSSTAMIEYQPLLAGQSSPFKVMVRWNPAMKTSRVEFKRFGRGEIKTLHSWKK